MTAKKTKTISQRTALRWKRQSQARDRELVESGKVPPEAMFLIPPEMIAGAKVVRWPKGASLSYGGSPKPRRKHANKPKHGNSLRRSKRIALRMETGLGPLVGPNPTVLILGSFPSEESLRSRQYYANPRNQFWRLLEVITGIKHDLPYEQRIQAMMAKDIALWDVLHSCARRGSLDREIQMGTVIANDLTAFLDKMPSIKAIGLNGGTAARMFDRYFSNLRARELEIVTLPSSSSAHAVELERKARAWAVLMDSAAQVAGTMP